MSTDSKDSIESILKIIDNKVEQKEDIHDIISFCEEKIIEFPNQAGLKNKLEFLHDLAQSEEYINNDHNPHEKIDLDTEFNRISGLDSDEEILSAYKKLEKKYPGHKGVQEGIRKYSQEQTEIARGDMSQIFREITQMQGHWGEPDYEGQKARLLELQERHPFHEGVKIALNKLEEGKKNNFKID